MKLTELFTGNKQIDASGNTQQQSAQHVASVNRQIHALKPGQTMQGEVIARNGSEVQIKVAEDFVIKARVEQNINLDIGKNMTFEVKNNGQTLTLLPLYTNTATDANVLKALDMASLPVNVDTVSMTEQMMKAGMSIDKNSLQQIFRESNLYPESNVSDIIDLHKLSIPVNEENLTQIASYKNLTHQLVNGFQELTNALPDTMQNMMQKGNVEGAARLFQDILQLISVDGELPGGESASLQGTLPEASQGMLQDALQGAIQGTQQGNEGIQQLLDLLANLKASGAEASVQTTVLNGMGMPEEGQLPGQHTTNQTMSEQPITDSGLTNPNPMQQDAATSNAASGTVSNTVPNSAAASESAQMSMVQGQTVPEQTSNPLNNQAMELLNRLVNQGIENRDTALLRSLLGNKEVMDFVKNNLQNMWTISPQDVAEADKVEELYQKLGRQLKSLTQALETANQTNSEAYRATTNLSQNIDFLQQMNQTYTYLQLPLRLQQGNNAHGDLYVYSNKKHLAAQDGKITALLHLDMENLGPLDVYVAMQNEKVNTKFYLQDDEMLDFLGQHMHILTERLKKRGYDYQCEMVTREQENEKTQNVIEHLLEKEPQVPLVQYAFDVRT